ncbi:MAG: hypothetical protein Q9227_008133 [Pyrenula ochraceoflavens]
MSEEKGQMFREPPPPRRRKKRPPEEDLFDKCRRYEEMLKSYGAQIDAPLAPSAPGDDSSTQKGLSREATRSLQNESEATTSSPGNWGGGAQEYPKGKLVVDQMRSRLVDNNLWVSLSEEFRNPTEILEDSCSSEDEEAELPRRKVISLEEANEEDIIFGSAPRIQDLGGLHPNEATIHRLWHFFVENVNPLSKVLHIPTTHTMISEAARDIQNTPKNLEVLMFAIYACAVASLTIEECRREFGQERSRFLAKWLGAGRIALQNSRFLRTSDMMVLQGFVLYLLAARPMFDPRSLWTISGIAMRIGQRIGLHRDGAEYGLDPFEVNMRSRLWWQIIWIDARSAELSGSAITHLSPQWETRGPLNVNDSDIYPGMENPPPERQGATEMMFVLLRYEMAQFFKDMKSRWVWKGTWYHRDGSLVQPEEKEALINELENTIERKFLRYCDPLIPLHLITTIVARSIICIGRIISKHPRHRADKGASMTQEDKDIIFQSALKALEYDTLAVTNGKTSHFLWHTHAYFQWPAVIVLVDMLRTRTLGDDVDKAWRQLEDVAKHHPEISQGNSAIHNACAGLAIKAWGARSTALQASNPQAFPAPPTPPHWITTFQTRRASKRSHRHGSKDNISSTTPSDTALQPYPSASSDQTSTSQQTHPSPSFNIHQPLYQQNWGTPEEIGAQWQDIPFSQSPMDWNEWDQLLQGFEVPGVFAPDIGHLQPPVGQGVPQFQGPRYA